jgi:hypothetical protein
MGNRYLIFMPLALKARQAFVSAKHEAALDALSVMDKLVQSRPESGTETPRKGRFILKMKVSASQNIFLCEIIYSFTPSVVRWENFAWKVVKAD